ncbi:MAG TPA: PepSY-associated TM helix domain-containing protein [Trinickia sp.]|jgi:hypothetical protein|uniref:PepSY-associated TM helix domain-containing protein n=1 Tax=Trinickia sp. TaxID=2571163 RepID=UPI002CA3262E|nr:PepSY-associated TM helix domain-containing protein [Trinickia sp.]HVW52427.1 PepSY-associated TM helix domain-containing protein [Trinickia sp.]
MTVSEATAPLPAVSTYVEESRAKRSRRATFIKWLRHVHGWVGLWGAALGMLFGVTGFVLNHRVEPLRIATGAPQVSTVQAKLPDPAPATPHALANWLREQYALTGRLGRIQHESAHRVSWGAHDTVQPEHWQLMFSAPNENVMAEYWKGNDFVTLKRSENAFVATLVNLHRGVGLGVGWVLLIDTIAGSLVLLSLTGVLLWTQLHRTKTLAVVLVSGSLALAIWAGLA